MAADIYFTSEEYWSVTGGLFDLVLEEIARMVTSTSLSGELIFTVENNFGVIALEQLSDADQLEFLHAITNGMRNNVLAEIPADNAIRHLTTARLDDLVEMAERQLELREQ